MDFKYTTWAEAVGFERHENELTLVGPNTDDIIVFEATPANSAGHIAIIKAVTPDDEVGPKVVTIVEQNWTDTGTVTLPFEKRPDGTYRVLSRGSARVLGWMRPRNVAPPAKTGQTACYSAIGNSVTCLGSGQDGEFQVGITWPTPRFSPRADQTLYDNLTGLSWAADVSTPTMGSCGGGAKTWQGALDYGACLNAANYLGHSDWRLPNANELASLANHGATSTVSWLTASGFLGAQPTGYWASTTFAANTLFAGAFDFGSSASWGAIRKTDQALILPVRGVANGPGAVPQTGQRISYALGDDGDLQEGVPWLPALRFTDHANGTVTDTLTSLMWTKITDFPNSNVTWQGALDYVAGMNAGTQDNYGYTDWRLANINELQSMTDANNQYPALSAGHPFVVRSFGGQWSSTTDGQFAGRAWMYALHSGILLTNDKILGGALVWPVRGGR